MGTLLSCWMRGNSRHLCSLIIPVIPTTIPLRWVFPRAHTQFGFRIRTLTSETDIPPSEFGLSLGSIYALSTWNVFKDSGLTIFMKLISKFIPFWSQCPHHSYEQNVPGCYSYIHYFLLLFVSSLSISLTRWKASQSQGLCLHFCTHQHRAGIWPSDFIAPGSVRF